MLGVLCPSGYTPEPDGWLPTPLVEDRTNFGLHCITSSPLVLSFNVSNDTLVELLWDIIANEEAIAINQEWVRTHTVSVHSVMWAGGTGMVCIAVDCFWIFHWCAR